MTDNDQAAVEALLKVRCPPISKAYSHGDLAVPYREGAEAIIDAIRAGKGPGIVSVNAYASAHEADMALLRAEVERLTALSEHNAGVAADHMCRADKATAERDRLRDRLQTIQHSAQQASITGNDWQREIKLIKNICDAALAEIGGGK